MKNVFFSSCFYLLTLLVRRILCIYSNYKKNVKNTKQTFFVLPHTTQIEEKSLTRDISTSVSSLDMPDKVLIPCLPRLICSRQTFVILSSDRYAGSKFIHPPFLLRLFFPSLSSFLTNFIFAQELLLVMCTKLNPVVIFQK